MRADAVLGVVTVAMAILGGIVSVHAPETFRSKLLCGAAFLLLGAVCILSVIKQSNENAASNANLASSFRNLSAKTDEVSRITTLNTDLQHQLLKSTETIAELSRTNIHTVTGGDSFCYFMMSPPNGFLTAVQQGAYPLRDVTARMVDVEVFMKAVPTGNLLNAGTTNLEVGDLSVGSARILGNFPVGDGDKHDFNIFFNGLNGFWTQLLRLRRVNGKWEFAIQVTGPTKKEPFENVSAGYPRNAAGKIDWTDH